MAAIKCVVGSSFVVVLMLLIQTARYGKRSHHDLRYCDTHRRYATLTFWVTITAIILTEGMVRVGGGIRGPGTLFGVHIILDAIFLGSLITNRFVVTGLKNRGVHRFFAYTCLVSYGGVFVTGFILLWKF